ncbi:PRP38 family-domain-containing protein [Globomyces pollinis-pini]|nr:PRP38 family-domain-containing protein [Globomyces pollinis-pini]
MQDQKSLGFERRTVHGQDPQFLIEKIMRERIYECLYWKEKMFGVNAEIMVDRGVDLKAIGGQWGNQRPSEFLACTLKLLQIQPEKEILQLYLDDPDFKYLTALAAFYIRLTGTSVEIYKTLEPFLLDKRKLRKRMPSNIQIVLTVDGTFELTYMDVFIDELLTEDRVCDTILPRLTKRYILEDAGDLEPRISPLEEEIDNYEEPEPEPEPEQEVSEPEIVIPLEEIDPLHKEKKKKYSKKKVKGLFKKVEKPIVDPNSSEGNTQPTNARTNEGYTQPQNTRTNDESISIEETNRIRASLGIEKLRS